MSRNLRKFVNPKFIRTVDLGLLRRLCERHQSDPEQRVDLALFDQADDERTALQEFFAGPEENYPEGLVADLHLIAELGNANGLRLLQEQAARLDVVIASKRDEDGSERRQDPKHVALRMFLEERAVFDAASDMLALTARTSLAEYAGLEEGVEARVDDSAKAEFAREAAAMFEADLCGRYCRLGWYEDDDEVNLVVAHGSAVNTTPVIEQGMERVISYRAAEHAVLSYSASTGRLKVGGVPKARRAEFAELFARTILRQRGFFAGADAQRLYTLEPVQRAGFGFAFNHAFDPAIQRVQIIEARINRLGTDPRSGKSRAFWSHSTNDSGDKALARLGEVMRGVRFGAEWQLNHIVIRVHIATGATKPSKVTVKIKPPDLAAFKRQRFEAQIMTLLRRNGLVHERESGQAAAAA